MQWIRVSTIVLMFLAAVIPFSSCGKTENKVQVDLVELQTADNVRLDGALHQPLFTGSKVGVIMVHGYGGNFYSGIMAFLPEALAVRGFATLALNMRDHDLGPKKNRFEENLLDIAAGVDEMSRRGYDVLFLYGHSMGTNRVLYYLAETSDPRIAGLILSGPPGNLFQWNVRIFGRKKATDLLRRAQEMTKKGAGDEWMLINLGPLGKTLYTANHVVSLRGPETRSDPFRNIARVSTPVLIVHGLADRLADPQVSDQLKNDARTIVTVRKITNADHRFRGHQEELVEVIYQWLVGQLSQ